VGCFREERISSLSQLKAAGVAVVASDERTVQLVITRARNSETAIFAEEGS